MTIKNHYSAECYKCGRYFGEAVNEPTAMCNVSIQFQTKNKLKLLEKLIQNKWIESIDGWTCPECIAKEKELQ